MSTTRWRALGVAVVGLVLCHAPLAGQDQIMVGERARLSLLDGRLVEGVVVGWEAGGISLRTDRDTLVEPEWSEVLTVERLSSRRRTVRGLGLGAAIGGLAGVLGGAILVEPCDGTGLCVGPNSRAAAGLGYGLLGAAAGGIVGAIVGASVTTPSWVPVVAPSGDLGGAPELRLLWRR